MAIGPMGVGDTLPAWNFTIVDSSTNAALNLTGATLALTIIDQRGGATWAAGGTLLITSASTGQGQYQWATADLPYTGTFLLRLRITFSSGRETASQETVTVF